MKTIDEYMALPYTIELIQERDSTWFVQVKELPGCISVGETPDDAIQMIRDAQRTWLKVALEDDIDIPEPLNGEFSGKFNLRVPKSVHRRLANVAEEEGVSLNTLCVSLLVKGLGEITARLGANSPARSTAGEYGVFVQRQEPGGRRTPLP